MRVDQPKDGGRTLVIVLQAATNETEEDVLDDVITCLVGMSSLAPRLDPPADDGISILVQKDGCTLYTAKAGLTELVALGDERLSLSTLSKHMRFTRPLGTQATASLQKIRSDTEKIREHKAKKAVPFGSIDAERLRANMQDELTDKETQADVQEDQALLSLLGIIGPETDLGELYVERYAEQSDVMGELGLRLALGTNLGMGAAMQACEGWGGDRYMLLQKGEGEAQALAMRTKGFYFTVTETTVESEHDKLSPVTQSEAIALYEGTLSKHEVRFAEAFPGVSTGGA